MTKERRTGRYVIVGLVVVIGALGAALVLQHYHVKQSHLFTTADTRVQTALAGAQLPPVSSALNRQGLFGGLQARITVDVPGSIPLEESLAELEHQLEAGGVQVQSVRPLEEESEIGYVLQLGLEETTTHHVFLRMPRVRVALLFDDFGYCNDQAVLDAFFRQLDVPFSVAIIPGTAHATDVAEQAYKSGKEILVHMPMQPQGEYVDEYKWFIAEGMTAEQIRVAAREAIASVPHAQGMNNHMGSLATTREELIGPVLEVLQDEGLYFVDSRTISSSIAYNTAQKFKIPSTHNCVFLDNKKESTYIQEQFQQLLSLAKQQGWAVGLAHCHPVTAAAVKAAIASQKDARVRYVNMSEIVQ